MSLAFIRAVTFKSVGTHLRNPITPVRRSIPPGEISLLPDSAIRDRTPLYVCEMSVCAALLCALLFNSTEQDIIEISRWSGHHSNPLTSTPCTHAPRDSNHLIMACKWVFKHGENWVKRKKKRRTGLEWQVRAKRIKAEGKGEIYWKKTTGVVFVISFRVIVTVNAEKGPESCFYTAVWNCRIIVLSCGLTG